jgi:hypothetical protein
LSAWRDADSAHKWYRGNQAHAAVVEKHKNKKLSTFSASLAPLQAACPIRYHNRCHECRHLNCDKETTNCEACNKPLRPPKWW